MLLVALRMPYITNFASRPHPPHTEKYLVPNKFKYIRPYRDYLYGTLSIWSLRLNLAHNS